MSNNKLPEQWRPIPDYEGMYEVSDHGRVRSLDRMVYAGNGRDRFARGRMLKLIEGGHYLFVMLRDGSGKATPRRVHRLVLEAFVGPRPAGMECRHLDGVRRNCHLDNLACGTRAENDQDRGVHGSWAVGERHGMVRLDAQTVQVIRDVAAKMFTQKQIADALGISFQQVSRIIRRERWKEAA
jgi:HNH endonuclease/NUMOD4 motif/Helix-turn-helix